MAGVLYQKQNGNWTPVLIPDAGEPPIAPGTTGQYWRGDKVWASLDKAAVGLSNVDNTPDANKPLSTLAQTGFANRREDKTWGVLTNRSTFLSAEGSNPAEMYIHGYVDGVAADVDGYVMFNNTRITVPKGEVATDDSQNAFTLSFLMLDPTGPLSARGISQIGSNPQVVAVARNNNLWYYDNNSTWVTFTPLITDLLIATFVKEVTNITEMKVLPDPIPVVMLTEFPVSSPMQTALDGKQAQIVAGTTSQYYRGDKTWQTLGSAGLLNVPAAGNAAAGEVVKGDDTRLADSRTPTTHSHAIGDLPVATGGTSSSTQLVRANDPRLSDARTPTGHAHPQSDITGLVTALADKVPEARQINAGNGLSGGGALTADRTLQVVYGTTAGTAAQGNDARLSDARTPTAHTHDDRYYTETESDARFSPIVHNTTTVVYTTTVPARPAGAGYVIWQGQVDPAANALPGDEWHPTA